MLEPRHAVGFALAAVFAVIAYFVGHPFFWFASGVVFGGTMTALAKTKPQPL